MCVCRAEKMYIDTFYQPLKIKRNACPLRNDLGKSLQAEGGEKGLLRRAALLVVFWRRGVHQWLDSGVRSGRKLFFLSVLKAEAGLGEEAAVGEDTEDIQHPDRFLPKLKSVTLEN